MTGFTTSSSPLRPAWMWVAAICGGMQLSALAVGDDWQLRSPLPTLGHNLTAVAHDGSQWIAVGKEGSICTSADAIAWTRRVSPASDSLYALAWTGTILTAVGENGGIVTSSDGVNWIKHESPIATNLLSVTWTGSQLVAAGDEGVIVTSTDAIHWSPIFTAVSTDWRCVSSSGGLLVAVGSKGAIATSSTGLSWTTHSSGTTRTLRSVASDGSTWVAVGDAGTVVTSSNGTVWSLIAAPTTHRLNHITWDGGQFFALGEDGLALTSTDGQTWTAQPLTPAVTCYGAIAASGQVVVVGDRGTIASAPVAAGPWIERAAGSREWLHDSVWTGTQFVAVGSSGTIRTSADGVAWSSQTSGTVAHLNGVAWTGSRVIAVGDAGTVLTSSDGISWASHPSGTSRSLQGVAWTGSQIIAVGLRGAVTSSVDGLSWSGTTIAGSPNLRSIAALGSQVIAVGDGGVAYTFAGSTWTARSTGITDDLTSVSTNGTLAVASGQGGRIIASTTSLASWTTRTSPFSGQQSSGMHGLHWTGSEFVMTGHGGSFSHPNSVVVNSLDGITWIVRLAGVGGNLRGTVSSSTQTIAFGEAGLILTNDSASMPSVQFVTNDGAITEEGGTYMVSLSLSVPTTGTVIVPIQLSGSALIGTDANVFPLTVTIAAGQQSGSLAITALANLIDQPDRTVVLALGTPLGATAIAGQVTVTILDDDTVPIFGPPPVGDLVLVGTAVSFSTPVTGGSPLNLQWLLNEKAISKATQDTFSIGSAALSHAGAYRLQAQNPSATLKSAIAELGVVDGNSKSLSYIAGATAVLTVSASGNGLSFQWQRNEVDVVADTRITGVTTNRLTITGVTGKDAGKYRCVVSNPSGSLLAGTNMVSVTTKPFIVPPAFDVVTVSQLMEVPVYAGNAPTRFYISGLPSGLTYDPITGLIFGRPLSKSGSQPFQVTISASNAAGVGPSVKVPLTVQGLPFGTEGNYVGIIDRATGLNATSHLGGRVSLMVASTGKVTGSVIIGSSSHALTSTLETSPITQPEARSTIARPPASPLLMEMHFDPSNQLVTGTLSSGAFSTTFTARNSLVAPFSSYTGYHTASIQLATPGDVGKEEIPQGAGYTYFTIGSTGLASGLIRLADGTQFLLSSPLRSNGDLVVYAPLYGNTGSLLGSLKVTPGNPALVTTSSLTWFKDNQPSTVRTYRNTFGPISLAVSGARYTAPSAIVMGLSPSADDVPNAALTFSEGGVPDPVTRLNIRLRYSATAVRDAQTPASNPGFVTINVTPSNGLLSGGFKLMDTDPTTSLALQRDVLWYGIIARDTDGTLRGYGHFQLAKLPSLNDSPPTTKNTTSILSGKVSLLPFP
ncbi:MAG: immunoglobulin domain-containing protein [Verrucomicrobiaceae bacterium]|nr:immunoglobulin domain-containing protein [Verrucomicrobiaceae bacterium]